MNFNLIVTLSLVTTKSRGLTGVGLKIRKPLKYFHSKWINTHDAIFIAKVANDVSSLFNDGELAI
jgi:hypothetical protein